MHRANSTLDLISAALCAVLKLFSYWLRHLLTFYQPSQTSFILVLVLCELTNRAVPVFWCEIKLSFEAAVFNKAHAVFADPEDSNVAKKAATKANRKASSIPDTLQAFLEVSIDQSITSFTVFLKAGCSWPIAFGASVAMLCFPFVLQLRSKGLVSEVSACRRQKETLL